MKIPVNPFDFNFDRTAFADDTYSLIGRALTIATKFESEVKSIASFFKLKANFQGLSDEQGFNSLIKELQKYKALDSHIRELSFSKGIKSVMIEAKNSRNFIAHNLTLGLEITSETDNGRNDIIDELKQHIPNIIEAEKILLVILCSF